MTSVYKFNVKPTKQHICSLGQNPKLLLKVLLCEFDYDLTYKGLVHGFADLIATIMINLLEEFVEGSIPLGLLLLLFGLHLSY